jgi:hypothetical protein
MHSALTVVSPNANKGLTTLTRLKSELGISGATDDALLGAKILEASSDIETHLNCVLRSEVVSETFWSFGGCPDVVVLGRYPVSAIGSVTVDGELVPSGEYRLVGEAGLLYRLDDAGYPSRWRVGRELVVQYTAGYVMPAEGSPTLPAVLEAACLELLGSYWTARGRDPLVREEQVEGIGRTVYWVGAVGASGALPPGVDSKISAFRRVSIG